MFINYIVNDQDGSLSAITVIIYLKQK